MPESVEMPAPVSTVTHVASATHLHACATWRSTSASIRQVCRAPAARSIDAVAVRRPMPEETWTDLNADRSPTAAEESAAERAARDVDVERVADHEQEMNAAGGANVRGEGQIEP